MAVILPATIFDQIKGSLGSLTFYVSPYGQCVKNKPSRASRQTVLKANQQQFLTNLSLRWKALSIAEQDAWTARAPDFPFIDRFGNPYTGTGFALFMQTNLLQGFAASSLITTPPTLEATGAAWTPTYAGPAGQFRFTLTENSGNATVYTIFESTPALPAGQTTPRKRYQYVGRNTGRTTTGTVNLTTQWVNLFGTPASGLRVFWRVTIRNTNSPEILGFATGELTT